MRNTFVKQHDATDCAAACLAMVCLHYKKETTITQLRDMMGTDLKGTNLVGLSKCADELGFVSQPVRVDRENFMTDFTLPCIANVITKEGMTHFVVVFKKIRRKKVIIMEMCYDGTLVMPANYAVVSEDEMTYVDGGAYMTNEDCEKFILALGLTIFSNPAAVATAISVLGSIGASAFASIPVVGWIVGIVGVGYLTFQAKDFAESLCGALASGKSVDISLGWYWCVPKMEFEVM